MRHQSLEWLFPSLIMGQGDLVLVALHTENRDWYRKCRLQVAVRQQINLNRRCKKIITFYKLWRNYCCLFCNIFGSTCMLLLLLDKVESEVRPCFWCKIQGFSGVQHEIRIPICLQVCGSVLYRISEEHPVLNMPTDIIQIRLLLAWKNWVSVKWNDLSQRYKHRLLVLCIDVLIQSKFTKPWIVLYMWVTALLTWSAGQIWGNVCPDKKMLPNQLKYAVCLCWSQKWEQGFLAAHWTALELKAWIQMLSIDTVKIFTGFRKVKQLL